METQQNEDNDFGFIILRHVNSKQTDYYWKECYRCIRKLYPTQKIVIIDDLAKRDHHGNLLIDQNWFGKDTQIRYNNVVNNGCELLLGPSYFMNKFDCSPKRHFTDKLNPT